MVMIAQPRPWWVTAGREIGDSNGNVVQYTMENLGQICLAVNAYDRLVGALAALDTWFSTPGDQRDSESDMRDAVRLAMGRIGCELIASMIEAAPASSWELNRRISSELSIPEVDYTGSTDAAMTLIPKGWKYSVSDVEQLDVAANVLITVFTVEVRGPNGEAVLASNPALVRAICASAMRAQDLARGA